MAHWVCRGAGRVISKPCLACRGAGRVGRQRKITAKISDRTGPTTKFGTVRPTVATLITDLKNNALLDKTLIVYGSPMADSNLHSHRRCPLVLLGHANGQLAGNMHVKAPDGTPMANALLSVAHTLGMDDMKSLGDSTNSFSFVADA